MSAFLTEWLNEPNSVEFVYKGYNCEIKRIPDSLHLCGYVFIDKDNKLFNDEIAIKHGFGSLRVHGGITFVDKTTNKLIIGFDCCHAGDYTPGRPYYKGIYKNIEYVVKELHNLVDQIIELNSKD